MSGVFLEKIHKEENINGEGAKRPSGGKGVEGGLPPPSAVRSFWKFEVEMDHSEACEGPVCWLV